MGSYTTNSYGPIIYTSPGENKDNKNHTQRRRRQPSAYKRLNKDYDVNKHTWAATVDNLSAIRQTMSLRIKDKFLEEMSRDLDNGYIAKIGADVYVIKALPSAYMIYLREGTKRKAYKRRLRTIHSNGSSQSSK